VYDNLLIVGGYFDTAGGISTGAVARWDGESWSAVSGGPWHAASFQPAVEALSIYGGGLVASGDFVLAAGVPARNIARWNGSSWAPLGSGLDGVGYDLIVDGDNLWVGGWFGSAGDQQSTRVALWQDSRTPVEVQDLEAVTTSRGVHLAWRLSTATLRDLASIRVQRAGDALGPYVERSDALLVPEAIMAFDDEVVEHGGLYWYRLVLRSRDGAESVAGPIAVRVSGVAPNTTTLHAPCETLGGGPITVRYRIGARTDVRLAIYDVRGRRMRILDNGVREPGDWLVAWDRRAAGGAAVARGLYFVHLDAGSVRATRKLLLVHP
jgi:hypothetical protein